MTTKKEFRTNLEKQTHQSGKAVKFRFTELLGRFERTVSVLGRSQSTFNNYSRHVASVSLHFRKIPTELDSEQIHDYLFTFKKIKITSFTVVF